MISTNPLETLILAKAVPQGNVENSTSSGGPYTLPYVESLEYLEKGRRIPIEDASGHDAIANREHDV